MTDDEARLAAVAAVERSGILAAARVAGGWQIKFRAYEREESCTEPDRAMAHMAWETAMRIHADILALQASPEAEHALLTAINQARRLGLQQAAAAIDDHIRGFDRGNSQEYALAEGAEDCVNIVRALLTRAHDVIADGTATNDR